MDNFKLMIDVIRTYRDYIDDPVITDVCETKLACIEEAMLSWESIGDRETAQTLRGFLSEVFNAMENHQKTILKIKNLKELVRK